MTAVCGVEISTLAKLKVVLTRARDRGHTTGPVKFQPPLAAAIGRAEREYLCPDDLLTRAKA